MRLILGIDLFRRGPQWILATCEPVQELQRIINYE